MYKLFCKQYEPDINCIENNIDPDQPADQDPHWYPHNMPHDVCSS